MRFFLTLFVSFSIAIHSGMERGDFLTLLEQSGTPCGTAKPFTEEMPSLLVFISFSVPKATWRELDSQLQSLCDKSLRGKPLDGAFILRGLPKNSFSELADGIKDIGSTVLIDPRPFEEYGINKVPAFVLVKGDKFDKVEGNISLSCALDLIANQGETHVAN